MPKAGDRVRIIVGGPHENYLQIAVIAEVLRDGNVIINLNGHGWVYSPDELEKLEVMGEYTE